MERNKSIQRGEKLAQMNSMVGALKFYGAAALASIRGQGLDMPVAAAAAAAPVAATTHHHLPAGSLGLAPSPE